MNRNAWVAAAIITVAAPAASAQERSAPMSRAELGYAIAQQGDAALVEIRRDSTRLAPPAWPAPPPRLATEPQTPTVENTRARARIVALRRDVYVDRPPR